MHRLVSDHLAAHHSLVTTAEMLALGLSRRQIDWMVSAGELVRMFSGVYRSSAIAPSPELRIRAGMLAAGDRAVLSLERRSPGTEHATSSAISSS